MITSPKPATSPSPIGSPRTIDPQAIANPGTTKVTVLAIVGVVFDRIRR